MTWLATFALGAATLGAASAGTLDPRFGGDGRVVVDHGPGFDVARAVLVQPDAKIVVAGSATPNGDIVVTRLNADGSLDAGFGAGGTARADLGGAAIGQAAALQPDGKILVAGAMEPHLGGAGVIARFNRDGSLDSSFAGDGRLTLGFRRAVSVLVQPDRRIAVAGESDGDLQVVRLYPDGSPDGTVFDRADFGGDDHHAAAALAPDGSILVAGTSSRFEHSAMAVARFKPDGALDPAFGYGGKVTVVHANLGGARTMAFSPDGHIVVVGFTADPFDVVVTRLRADGRPDRAFGLEGTAEIDFGGRDVATGVAVQPDGAIVIGGITTVGHDMAAARLAPDGRLDPRFGSGGRATIDFGETDFAHAVALQPDGRIVLAGQTSLGGNVAVARLRADPPPPYSEPATGDRPGGGVSGAAEPTAPDRLPAPPPRPRCGGRVATIVGTPGRDTIRGTPFDDVIVTLGGNDRIDGRGGNDLVCAGRGHDTLTGGPGADRLLGQQDRDRLDGGPGRDWVHGGLGRDRCAAGTGRDRVRGCKVVRSP